MPYSESYLTLKFSHSIPKKTNGTRRQLCSTPIMIGNTYNDNGIMPNERMVETIVRIMLKSNFKLKLKRYEEKQCIHYKLKNTQSLTAIMDKDCNITSQSSSSLVWTIMLCVCHTTPTQNGPVSNFLSGWATTAGRLLGPKMALRVFLKHATRYPASEVEPRFCNLSITSLALYQPSCVAAAICYDLSNHLL